MWQVDTAPMLTLGGSDDADSTTMLQKVVGAMRQSDGTVVVADNAASNLKFFDRAGALIRTVGRRGRGPGEFEYISYLWACGGDSAFVEDVASRLVSVVAPDGRIERAMDLRAANGQVPFTTSCARTGAILTSSYGDVVRYPLGPFRPTVAVAFATKAGNPGIRLGEHPGTEMVGIPQGAGPRRIGRWLHIAMAPSLAWVAPNVTGDILGFDLSGRLQTVLREDAEEPPLSAADRAFFDSLAIDSALTPRGKESMRRELAATPYPDRPPAVSAMLADADGNLWVRRHPRAAMPNPPWRVFRPDGVWLGALTLPPDHQILDIGPDYLLALTDDAQAGQTVRVFRLTRPRASGR